MVYNLAVVVSVAPPSRPSAPPGAAASPSAPASSSTSEPGSASAASSASVPRSASTSSSASVPRSVADALREAILQGDLSPGEQIRQAAWAEHLGTSRIPVREALKSLAAEGLLSHDHNRGYFVIRFGADEMAQIYLMRRLLETELLRSLSDPPPATLGTLRSIGEAAARAKMGDDFELWNQLEHDFHSQLYGLSAMNLVRGEFERLWLLSNIYRRLNRAVGQAADSPAVTYYASMLEALAEANPERMVDLMTHLRAGSERWYAKLLQRRGS